jgi:hypothetical protein
MFRDVRYGGRDAFRHDRNACQAQVRYDPARSILRCRPSDTHLSSRPAVALHDHPHRAASSETLITSGADRFRSASASTSVVILSPGATSSRRRTAACRSSCKNDIRIVRSAPADTRTRHCHWFVADDRDASMKPSSTVGLNPVSFAELDEFAGISMVRGLSYFPLFWRRGISTKKDEDRTMCLLQPSANLRKVGSGSSTLSGANSRRLGPCRVMWPNPSAHPRQSEVCN